MFRPIYTIQLCRMQYAYDESTTRVVRVNQTYNLLAIVVYDTKKCRGLLKHVLKPYDKNRTV